MTQEEMTPKMRSKFLKKQMPLILKWQEDGFTYQQIAIKLSAEFKIEFSENYIRSTVGRIKRQQKEEENGRQSTCKTTGQASATVFAPQQGGTPPAYPARPAITIEQPETTAQPAFDLSRRRPIR